MARVRGPLITNKASRVARESVERLAATENSNLRLELPHSTLMSRESCFYGVSRRERNLGNVDPIPVRGPYGGGVLHFSIESQPPQNHSGRVALQDLTHIWDLQ